MDREPGEATDDGAVDADELEISADLELDAVSGVLGIPAFNGVGDQGANLAPAGFGQVHHDGFEPCVDLGLKVRVIDQPVGEGRDGVGDATTDVGIGVSGRAAKSTL